MTLSRLAGALLVLGSLLPLGCGGSDPAGGG